jgi:hypothetical protein
MSKYKKIKTQLKDRDALVAALEGCEIPHETGADLPLYGYEGHKRPETAEIVVRRQDIGPATNDLGFKWNAEAGVFDVIISEFDSRSSAPGYGLHLLNRVRQEYAVQQVTALAEAQGYAVQPVEAEGGVVRLQLARW